MPDKLITAPRVTRTTLNHLIPQSWKDAEIFVCSLGGNPQKIERLALHKNLSGGTIIMLYTEPLNPKTD